MNYKDNKYLDIYKENSSNLNFDKEFSPFDYYNKFFNEKVNWHYCICTNQELVSNDEYCEICNGKIYDKIVF